MTESTKKDVVARFLKKAVKTGDIPGREIHAIIMMRDIHSHVSDVGGYWFNLGFYLKKLGRLQDAINAITKSLEFSFAGKRWPAYSMLGKLFSETNQRLEAEYWYGLAIKEQVPDPGCYWILRGTNFFMLGDFNKAKECYEVALNDNEGKSDKDEAYFNLGNISCVKGDYEEGLRLIKKSYFLDPNVKRTNRLLGDVTNLIDSGLKNIESQLHDKSKYELAKEYIKQEWYFCALEILRGYLKRYPKSSEAWERIGVCMINVGMGGEGKKSLYNALEYCGDSEKPVIFSTMGELCSDFGSLIEANEWYERAVSCQSNSLDWVWFHRGECLAKLGDYGKARDCFDESINCEGGWISPDEKYLNIGLMYRNEEKFDEATSAFREALRLNSENEKAKVALDGLSGIERTISETSKECERINKLGD